MALAQEVLIKKIAVYAPDGRSRNFLLPWNFGGFHKMISIRKSDLHDGKILMRNFLAFA